LSFECCQRGGSALCWWGLCCYDIGFTRWNPAGA
jgi:hypothetical protein